jgi:hypothetical protein
MRSVTVNAVLNGWTVQVGCQTLVYTDPDKLTGDLRDYLRDPKAKEAAVIESAVNKRLLQDVPAVAQAPMPTLNTIGGCDVQAASMPQELRRR